MFLLWIWQDINIFSILYNLPSTRAVSRIWSRQWYFESRRLWGPKAPTQARGLGVADTPSGVQGQSPVGGPGGESPGSKINLTFDIAKNWLSLSILDKFWSGWLIGNSRYPPLPKKILKSRVLQMPFPAFSRGISHQKDNHNREQKTFYY